MELFDVPSLTVHCAPAHPLPAGREGNFPVVYHAIMPFLEVVSPSVYIYTPLRFNIYIYEPSFLDLKHHKNNHERWPALKSTGKSLTHLRKPWNAVDSATAAHTPASKAGIDRIFKLFARVSHLVETCITVLKKLDKKRQNQMNSMCSMRLVACR